MSPSPSPSPSASASTSFTSSSIFTEALSKHFGFYYTIKKTILQTKTPYQSVEIVDTEEFGKVLLLDRITQVVEKNEFLYHELLGHIPLLSHANPKDVLIIGGGDGGIAREALKHPSLLKLTHVELDKAVVDICKQHLSFASGGAFDHPKYQLIIEDGRSFVEHHPNRYDVVIMDMTDPIGPSKKLYTVEFFRLVQRSLKTGGFFAMHTGGPLVQPKLFGQLYQTLATVFDKVCCCYNYIQMYGTLWSVAIGFSHPAPSIRSIPRSTLATRLVKRKLSSGLRLLNADTFYSMQVEFPYLTTMKQIPYPLLTDASFYHP